MTRQVNWDDYAPCPTCFRTWSCIAVADTKWPSDPLGRKVGWSKGWTELKRPHAARRLKRVETEALPGV